MRAPRGCALALAACVLLGGCAQQPEEPADPLAGWVGTYGYDDGVPQDSVTCLPPYVVGIDSLKIGRILR